MSAVVAPPVPAELSYAERVRTLDAADFIHDEVCPIKAGHSEQNCVMFASLANTYLTLALRHLDAHPRDARGARGILHDAKCQSGCVGEDRDDHAKRTQSRTVSALRRFRASEPKGSTRGPRWATFL